MTLEYFLSLICEMSGMTNHVVTRRDLASVGITKAQIEVFEEASIAGGHIVIENDAYRVTPEAWEQHLKRRSAP